MQDIEKALLKKIPFGKHRGAPIRDIPAGYINWLLAKSDHDWVYDNREALTRSLSYIPQEHRPVLSLAEDQQQAADEIVEALFEQGEPIYRLQGAAGYGKTFAAQAVVLEASERGYTVTAAATSYVATQNMAKDLEPLRVRCGTIASTLRLDVQRDKTKELYLAGVRTQEELPNLLGPDRLLIIDEYSMVDDKIGQTLIDAANDLEGHLLVIGDAHQLPSPAQNWDSNLTQVQPSSELWIPKRYEPGSDLHQVEKMIRAEGYFNPRWAQGSEHIERVARLEDLYKAYLTSYQDNPEDHHIMLWYRRQDMANANRYLRSQLYAGGDRQIAPGERLRVQRTSDYEEVARYYSGTTLVAKDVRESKVEMTVPSIGPVQGFTVEFPALFIEVDPRNEEDPDWIATMFSINENRAEPGTYGAEQFNEALSRVAQYCTEAAELKLPGPSPWTYYHALRNKVVQVAYQYASTVHRVQGQSIDRVFVAPRYLMCREPFIARKLQYVGLTRAKKYLTVF